MRRMKLLASIGAASVTVLAGTLMGIPAHLSVSPAYASGTVTFATWDSNPTEKTAQQKLVAAFEKKYHINVNFEVLSGDYNAKLKAAMTAGTAPDVFYINSDHVRDYITAGSLRDLSFLKKVTNLGFPKEFYSNLQYGYNYHGHPYAVVKDVSPLALWYNKDMFKAANISKPPTTWAQLETDACKLTNKSSKIAGLSLPADPARWTAFLIQAGGSLLNKSQTKATIDSTAGRVSLTYYTGLARKGCAQRPDQLGAGWDGEAFGKGVAAMTIEGNWMTSFMQQTYPSIHWGTALLPNGPKGAGNLAFTAGYAMFARTPNFKNASKLMEYLISKQGETTWTHVAQYVPPRKDVKPLSGATTFVKSIKSSKDWFFPAGFADRALSPIGSDIQKVQDGQMTVAAALADMQQQENKALIAAP